MPAARPSGRPRPARPPDHRVRALGAPAPRCADPLSEAARVLGVSERTLQRTVRRVLNTTPVRFVQDLRVEQATHLLRTTDLTLEAIARKAGYEHATTLRSLLRDRTGSTAGGLRVR
ncbi:helix-turn-helix domain-containing protein [Streptomyces platensis]|uniref:helix-turn-helix domain-containing protein n=1 Tax=Streptomyces platensis TaxID=58346 RepID=UPI002E26172E